QHIIAEIEAGIGQITINRPEVRNALDLNTLQEIEKALDEWRNTEDVSVVIFTGSGEKSFAAGADIAQLQKRTMLEALQPNM
ncbi:enoyl-CoA hydratase-related protein, partial [Frankia sp. Cpl3]|nr:enoyl-CoA hydratase-related protein [Frankia sp. Cpl3]